MEQNYKKKDKDFMKVESVKERVRYAFNISPAQNFTAYNTKSRTHDYAKPHKTFKDYVMAHLNFCKNAQFELYFELSPLGRQHYHGYITILNIKEFYTRDMQIIQSLGSFVGKSIGNKVEDPDIWHTYCTKQQAIWGTEYNIHITHAGLLADIPEPDVKPKRKTTKAVLQQEVKPLTKEQEAYKLNKIRELCEENMEDDF